MIDRKRQVDLNKLSDETLDSVAEQIGKKVNEILNKAYKECDEILKIYGLKLNIGYEIVEISKETKEVKE